MEAKCLHCKDRPGNRCRGLCGKCYYRLDVRNQYAASCNQHTVRRGVCHAGQPVTAPELPTATWPGTPDRVAEMMRRAESNQTLWHPNDFDPMDLED